MRSPTGTPPRKEPPELFGTPRGLGREGTRRSAPKASPPTSDMDSDSGGTGPTGPFPPSLSDLMYPLAR